MECSFRSAPPSFILQHDYPNAHTIVGLELTEEKKNRRSNIGEDLKHSKHIDLCRIAASTERVDWYVICREAACVELSKFSITFKLALPYTTPQKVSLSVAIGWDGNGAMNGRIIR